MSEENREAIRAVLAGHEHMNLIMEEWGLESVLEKGKALSMLFYGPPGTGKTLTAQAIADSQGLQLLALSTANLESSNPGEFERQLQRKFAEAKKENRVLLFDECDSLICDRNEVGIILGAQINCLLTCLENHEGIVVLTTNRLGRMDPALERRIALKLEFPAPDEAQRALIWKRLLPERLPVQEGITPERLAKFPLAGGNIKNAVLTAVRMAAYKKLPAVDEVCFTHAIKKELQSMRAFEEAREAQPRIGRLVGGPPRTDYVRVRG